MPNAVGIERILHKPTRVDRRGSKSGTEGVAVIVVADQQMHRHSKLPQTLGQRGVGRGLPPMCKVTRNNHETGVAVAFVDRCESALQAPLGIGSIQGLPRRDEVRVREVDELEHGISPCGESGPGHQRPSS